MYLAYLVQALLGMNVLLAVYLGEINAAATGAFMFLLGLIPHIITRYTRIAFPWFVYFLISLALLIHTSGYIQERYINYPNWDDLAHLVSGFIVSLIGFLAILFTDKIRNYRLDALFIGCFTIAFGMVMEYVWEIYEFGMDTFFGGSLAGPMQANNADTMSDMIFVLISGVIVGIGVYYYVNKYGKDNIMHNMVKDCPFFSR